MKALFCPPGGHFYKAVTSCENDEFSLSTYVNDVHYLCGCNSAGIDLLTFCMHKLHLTISLLITMANHLTSDCSIEAVSIEK